MKRTHIGFLLLVLIAGIVVYLYARGLIPGFGMIQEQRMFIEDFLMEKQALGVAIFSLIYILVVAFSIPIATPLTLLSGFLFGAVLGTAVVVVSATIGATIIFLLVRYFFRDAVTKKLAQKIKLVNEELTDHGFSDVLLLRLAPAVPFVLINAATALTSITARDYVLATFFGIIPFTFVYVLAGRRLGEIDSLREIVAPETLFVVTLIVLTLLIPIAIRRRRSGRSRG